MTIYLIWFAVIVALYVFGHSKMKRARNVYVLGVYLLGLALFVGFADMLGGYDRYIYAELFDRMADANRRGENPFMSESFLFYKSDFGYGMYCAVVSYITANRYIFILITTLVIYTLLFVSLKDYVNDYAFAVILFMGLFFFFTFTYLRQVMGVVTAWLAVRYIIKRKIIPFLIIVFVAFSLHNSAIIFLPLYFSPIKKLPMWAVIAVMVVCLLIGLSSIPSSLFEMYGELDAERANATDYARETGFRFEYLLEAVAFLSLILFEYSHIPNRKGNVVLLNIALLFCATLLIFIQSENGGRLAWYYMIGVIATLTLLATRKRKLSYYGIGLIVMSFLLYFRILYAWGIQLSPYKTFLTDGIREGDYIEEKYEYDHSYDTDKMYR
ncbi:MAG: EpsG family protein [Prevotella sp.]|nr:EpsG family protein [Prevotella sp.]